jgi:hypothetical protein
MTEMPLIIMALGAILSVIVIYLGVLFQFAPERGLAFATHKVENLPAVMANRYFSMAAVMVGSLVYGRPEVIAFVFAATGFGPAHDAWIYARAGQSYKKHVLPAVLSAYVAIGALIVYLNSGAT